MSANPSEPTAPAKPARGWSKFRLVVIVGAFGFAVLLWIVTQFFNAATLPGCDSKRARDTLSNVFNANKINATRYDEIKTIHTRQGGALQRELDPQGRRDRQG